jgi:hypothetical protein
MDPYIEAYVWEDFHDKLIGEIERTLAPVLPPRYVVRVAERSYVEFIDAAEGKPDVRVLSLPPSPTEASQSTTATALLEATETAFEMQGLYTPSDREILLQIEDVESEERLVTSIEILSPSNKRRGSETWQQYLQKRQVFLEGLANLVEIDLLRGGRRMPMKEPWPNAPYFVSILRKERAPLFTVLAAHYLKPLPVIPIPLLPPDADVPLALQPLVDAVYTRSRYALSIKYDRPLEPPLPPKDAEWLQQQLKTLVAS